MIFYFFFVSHILFHFSLNIIGFEISFDCTATFSFDDLRFCFGCSFAFFACCFALPVSSSIGAGKYGKNVKNYYKWLMVRHKFKQIDIICLVLSCFFSFCFSISFLLMMVKCFVWISTKSSSAFHLNSLFFLKLYWIIICFETITVFALASFRFDIQFSFAFLLLFVAICIWLLPLKDVVHTNFAEIVVLVFGWSNLKYSS